MTNTPVNLTSIDDPTRIWAQQRDTLASIISRHCPANGMISTPIPGVRLFRGSTTATPTCTIICSSFSIMAQGAKQITVGDISYEYDARHYLISSVELPLMSCITRASVQQPYLGLAMDIDPLKLNELAATLPQHQPSNGSIVVSPSACSIPTSKTLPCGWRDCWIVRKTLRYWHH